MVRMSYEMMYQLFYCTSTQHLRKTLQLFFNEVPDDVNVIIVLIVIKLQNDTYMSCRIMCNAQIICLG